MFSNDGHCYKQSTISSCYFFHIHNAGFYMKKIIINWMLLGFSVFAIFFAGAEIMIRAVFDDGMNYDLEMWKYARSLKQISENPGIGHEHASISSAHLMGVNVSINSLGLRGPEISLEKKSGEMRVLMLGDSLTFGWGVEESETTTRRLERLLRAKWSEEVTVINSGVGNYNTEMEVTYFKERGLALQPDIVVLNYFINDAEPIPDYDGFSLFASWSYAYILIKSRIDTFIRSFSNSFPNWKVYYQNLYEDGQKGWMRTKNKLRELASTCKKNNIPLLIVVYPEIRNLRDYQFKDVHEKLRIFVKGLGVEYLDLRNSVHGIKESKLWVTVPDPHPNGYANSFFAEAIYIKIRDSSAWSF
jgi:lysophospholipase L1-like esterase